MLYKVKNPQAKEWNDKKFVECYLQTINPEGEPEGEEYKVSFWAGEITNPDTTFKATIDGELSKNDKGYWKLTTAKKAAGGAYMNAQKDQAIEKAQERKEQAIGRAMDRKEIQIAYFNSRNTAIEFVKSFCGKELLSPSEALRLVNEYTQTFFDKWSDWENLDITSKRAPF